MKGEKPSRLKWHPKWDLVNNPQKAITRKNDRFMPVNDWYRMIL